MKKLLALFILIGIVSACANRWREGELSNQSVPDVLAYVKRTLSAGTGDTRMAGLASDINNDPNSVVYYSEAPSDLGPIYAVAPFLTFEFLSTAVSNSEINLIKVSYIDRLVGEGQHQGALIFDIELKNGNKIIDIFVNDSTSGLQPGYVEDGVFGIQLKNSAGKVITLYSDDTTDDDELADVLQFNVTDSQGVTLYGKLSTMIGMF